MLCFICYMLFTYFPVPYEANSQILDWRFWTHFVRIDSPNLAPQKKLFTFLSSVAQVQECAASSVFCSESPWVEI